MTVQAQAPSLKDRRGSRAKPLSAGRPRSRSSAPSDSAEGEARPFIKWVGGKRQLLPHLAQWVPPHMRTYHEPFVGGGALFFHMKPERAILSDNNERLVRTYRGVQNHVEEVIRRLKSFRHNREFYLGLRSADIDRKTDAEVAAWFIYLNRTGYNGLYRVNRSDRFNVPFGDHKNPTICDEANLRACSRLLQRAEIRHESFEHVVKRAKPRDFVYFDPPYVPLSASSLFTAYTAGGFSSSDHTKLRDLALKLKKRGVFVLLSNSSASLVRHLYAKDFTLTAVEATRMVSCKGNGRGPIREFVIR